MDNDTFFAPAARRSRPEIDEQHRELLDHPMVTALLQMTNSMLAILNKDRQIVAINKQLMDSLHLDSLDVLGLRFGESIKCVHSNDMPGGCGTGPFCETCPAAIAMVTSITEDIPVEKKCAISINRDDQVQDIFLDVKCTPVDVESHKYILMFIQDITAEQKWAAMEKVLCHDINNILSGVVSLSNLLEAEVGGEQKEIVEQIVKGSSRISQEVEMQRQMINSSDYMYKPIWAQMTLAEVASEINDIFEHHPAARDKKLEITSSLPDMVFETDRALVLRILDNMLLNAFEASSVNDSVKVSLLGDDKKIYIEVWNSGEIDATVKKRIFQRNISSKDGYGRGMGTYSMKFFGEEILEGTVDFKSGKDGTVFSFTMDRQRG
jgi:K+-sensing histidine kinase KdpD